MDMLNWHKRFRLSLLALQCSSSISLVADHTLHKFKMGDICLLLSLRWSF
jgi:hypothetical protein